VNGALAGTASAQQLARQFPHAYGSLNSLARDAFASGMRSGLRVVAALAAVGFLVAAGFIGGRIRTRPEPMAPGVTADAGPGWLPARGMRARRADRMAEDLGRGGVTAH